MVIIIIILYNIFKYIIKIKFLLLVFPECRCQKWKTEKVKILGKREQTKTCFQSVERERFRRNVKMFGFDFVKVKPLVSSFMFHVAVFWKIIAKKFGNIRKNPYLCNIVAKMTSATKICGIAKEKIFLSARDSFWWRSGKITKQGIGFKEEENYLHP